MITEEEFDARTLSDSPVTLVGYLAVWRRGVVVQAPAGAWRAQCAAVAYIRFADEMRLLSAVGLEPGPALVAAAADSRREFERARAANGKGGGNRQ